jgi:hypothetical protein
VYNQGSRSEISSPGKIPRKQTDGRPLHGSLFISLEKAEEGLGCCPWSCYHRGVLGWLLTVIFAQRMNFDATNPTQFDSYI